MDALFGIFPVALAIALAWLIFARRHESDDTTNDRWNPEDTEGDEDDEQDDYG
jgi:hypothetical protein